MKTQTVKHTPGPWTFDKSGSVISAPCDYSPKDGHAFVYKIAEISLVNTEANARLIAAAPELLEALNHIVREWEYAWGGQGQMPSGIVEHYQTAKAAIAKAEGNQ